MAKKKVYVYELQFRTYPGMNSSILFRTLTAAVSHAVVCMKNDLWNGLTSKPHFFRYDFGVFDTVVRSAEGVEITDTVLRIAKDYLNKMGFSYGQKQDSKDLERC